MSSICCSKGFFWWDNCWALPIEDISIPVYTQKIFNEDIQVFLEIEFIADATQNIVSFRSHDSYLIFPRFNKHISWLSKTYNIQRFELICDLKKSHVKIGIFPENQTFINRRNLPSNGELYTIVTNQPVKVKKDL
jgi:hypothetical protein